MNPQPQPAAQVSGIQQQLHAAEIEFCRLKAERESLELCLSEIDSSDVARASQIREELCAVRDRMSAAQIEQMGHRVTLLQAQLPHDREALMPVEAAFEQAERGYRQAYNDREIAAAALHNAKLKVSNAESNIGFYESEIERLHLQLTSNQGNRAKLTSEISSEINGLESRLRQLRTMTPAPIMESGLIG